MYEPDKPRVMEVTDPSRDLFSCMRGEHGVGWYVLAWAGGLALPTSSWSMRSSHPDSRRGRAQQRLATPTLIALWRRPAGPAGRAGAGVSGLLSWEASRDELVDSLKRAARGGSPCSPDVARRTCDGCERPEEEWPRSESRPASWRAQGPRRWCSHCDADANGGRLARSIGPAISISGYSQPAGVDDTVASRIHWELDVATRHSSGRSSGARTRLVRLVVAWSPVPQGEDHGSDRTVAMPDGPSFVHAQGSGGRSGRLSA